MTSIAATTHVARLWSPHLLCLVLPVTSVAFLATGPHPWWQSLPWLLVLVGSVLAENVRMLNLCRDLGFEVAPDPDDSTVMSTRLVL